MSFTQQRIRDPLHNIIEFKNNEFENMIWQLITAPPFQRLRRVKQLGFSQYVYPGATHTRFAHSIGVFHTARLLMTVIEKHLGANEWLETKAHQALAAALLHDVGHGAFSHAFEDVGKRLGLSMAHHETVSKALIKDSPITPILQTMGKGFHSDVADVIDDDIEPTIYSAVVSSQFDADRLDYMRRDRLMCGTGHGAIDFDWLLANIEIADIPDGVDDEPVADIKTFVLGPKALFAAESYIHGLFQLYPTVYFHKTTRGAEKIFSELLCQIIKLSRDERYEKTGLSKTHPLVKFALNPDSLECAQNLDDEVIFGALSQTQYASDPLTKEFSKRLRERKLYKCLDLRQCISNEIFSDQPVKDVSMRIDAVFSELEKRIKNWNEEHMENVPRILLDSEERKPYKKISETKGPVNQILIHTREGKPDDIRNKSDLVKSLETFKINRAYFCEDDSEVREFLMNEIKSLKKGVSNA